MVQVRIKPRGLGYLRTMLVFDFGGGSLGAGAPHRPQIVMNFIGVHH